MMILQVINDVRLSLMFIPAFLDQTIGKIFFLDIANSLLSALGAYEDLGKDAEPFSRRHPFACWLSVVVNSCGGGIISSILLGDPLLAFISDPVQQRRVGVLTFSWWFVFHCPFRFGFKLIDWFPVKFMLSEMREINRCVKVHGGVSQILKRYPNHHILMVIIGTIKGNGAGFMSTFVKLIRGTWVPHTELLRPSFRTKGSFVAAILFVLNAKTDMISIPNELLGFIIAAFFVFCKAVSLLRGRFEPFAPIENMLSYLFLGGIWDSWVVDQQKRKTE